MKILLLVPPLGSLTHPTLSLPSLTGYLRSLGHQVRQYDAGVASVDRLLSRDRLTALWSQAEKHRAAVADDSPEGARWKTRMLSASLFADDVAGKIEWAKAVMRSPELFYQPAHYAHAAQIIARAFEIISAACFPTRVTPRTLRYGNNLTFRDILETASDEARNPFLALLRDEILPALLADVPDVVGISVMYSTQLQDAFTLARLVKEAIPRSKIVLGGAAATEAETAIRGDGRAFQWVDAYVYGEGEAPLRQYLDLLATGAPKTPLSRRLHLADGGGTELPAAQDGNDFVDFDGIPGPDYEGLNLHDYLAPEIMFPVANHRGCYYRKCEFCSYAISFMAKFRNRSAARVQADIRALQEKHGARFFYFADDAVTPRRCKEIAEWSRRSPTPFYWNTEIRQEKEFTAEVLQALYAGGCRHLSFGNESGSQRILDLMNKKTGLQENLRILRDAAAAGIAVNLQNLIGFPGETPEEARDTVDMLVANREFISSFALGEFSLYEHAPIFGKADAFGVDGIEKENPGDLVPRYRFNRKDGLAGKALKTFMRSATAALNRSYPCGDTFLDAAYGSHALLYFQHFRERKPEKTFLPEIDPGRFADGVLHLKPQVRIAQAGSKIFLYASHNGVSLALRGSLAGLVPLLRKNSSMREILAEYGEWLARGEGGYSGKAIAEAMEALRTLHERGFLELTAARDRTDAAFAALHRSAHQDAAVRARLLALDDAGEFVAAVRHLAQSLGHELGEGEIAQAMQAGGRAWLERRLP